jgi:hypothetical protein
MDVLAIGRMKGKDVAPHIPAEQEAVARLRAAGMIDKVFLTATRTGPVILMPDTDAARAEETLSTLPFVTEDLVHFELIELEQLQGGARP